MLNGIDHIDAEIDHSCKNWESCTVGMIESQSSVGMDKVDKVAIRLKETGFPHIFTDKQAVLHAHVVGQIHDIEPAVASLEGPFNITHLDFINLMNDRVGQLRLAIEVHQRKFERSELAIDFKQRYEGEHTGPFAVFFTGTR